MAEEHTATAPAVEPTTTAVEATNEATSDATKDAAPATASSDLAHTNGDTAALNSDDATTAGPQATTEDGAPDGGVKTEADGAPAAADGSSFSGKDKKRKSSAGVPEHKTKKLSKKKSTAQLNLTAEPGQYYWARLKGYPPWPSIVCDEDMLPETLLATRPVSTKRPDGTIRDDFLDGGKNARDRTYPMMFLATNEFAWMVNTAITPLSADECVVPEKDKKMTKALTLAYEIAAEQHPLEYYKDMLKQFEEALREQMEEDARKAAEKDEADAKKADRAEKAKDKEPKKKSRKSAAGEDEMEVDDPEAAPKPSKKRKKEAESEGEGAKPKKTPKALKLNAPKTPGSTAKKPKTKKVVTKPEEDVEEKTEAPLSETDRLQKRETSVLYLRHRMQKGLLSRDTPPKEDEMAQMAGFFAQLEGYPDLEPQIIRTTKIHKVLKAVVRLTSIPKEEEYQFKKRASDMLSIWNSALALDGDAPPSASKEDGPATNGNSGPTTDLVAKAQENVEKTDAVEKPSAAPVEATELGNGAIDEADTAMADVADYKAPEAAVETAAEDAPAAVPETNAAAV